MASALALQCSTNSRLIPVMGKDELDKLVCPNIWVFIAQLLEHCSGNAEAMGSNPVEALKIFFKAKICSCLNCNHNCSNHMSILPVFPQFKSTSQTH